MRRPVSLELIVLLAQVGEEVNVLLHVNDNLIEKSQQKNKKKKMEGGQKHVHVTSFLHHERINITKKGKK